MRKSRVKNINDLAVYLTKKNAGKKQVPIGQVKEILKDLADLGAPANELMWKYYKRRAKQRGKR
jgi:hypothetical protein